jgi:hypothetical protein
MLSKVHNCKEADLSLLGGGKGGRDVVSTPAQCHMCITFSWDEIHQVEDTIDGHIMDFEGIP